MVTATVTGSGGDTDSTSAAANSALASDQTALLFHSSADALALIPPGFGYVHVGLSRIASWIGGANESGA